MDVAIVGGGLAGVATALDLARSGVEVKVFDQADGPGAGQSGNNSNVIHSGAFYKPGSLKAEMALHGRELMEAYIGERSLPLERTGKLVVQQAGEDERFDELVRRAGANGVEHEVLGSQDAIRDIEPLAAGQRALWLPQVAVTDFVAVLGAMIDDLDVADGEIEFRVRCVRDGDGFTANDHYLHARHIVVAAGAGFNRLCADKTWRISGFRGSYRQVLAPEPLPRRMIYAVPDPRYPFLGVHVTPSVDGTVTAGPNATPAFPFPAGRSSLLIARNFRQGLSELRTRFSSGAMQEQVRRYLPGAELGSAVVKSGVRAQAVDRRGRYADDFVFVRRPGVTFVANAPSPGATACFAIGAAIADGVREELGR